MECACGCGEVTQGGVFVPGHDEYVRSAVMYLCGDTLKLAELFGFGPGGRDARQIVLSGRGMAAA